MPARMTWGVAACLMWPLLTGCGQNPGIVRAQSPAAYEHSPALHGQQPPAYGQPPAVVPASGWLPGRHHPHHMAGHAGCPDCLHGEPGPHGGVGGMHGSGYGPGGYGPGGYGPGGYGAGGYGPGGYGAGGYGPGGYGPDDGGWVPTHEHAFSYQAPKNLVYPAANVPAAVVQYPYYTVKGPDCFFKRD